MDRILVADDDAHIREVVCFALQKAGFDTLEAATGATTLRQFEVHAPKLIVLDVMMPERDGIDVCNTLRRTSQVPILFLSARDEEVDRIIGLEVGGDDYMSKPFSPRELVARVKALLRRASAPADATNGSQTFGDLEINHDTFEASWQGQLLPLTHTEFSMLATLARAHERVLTRDALMQGAYEGNRVVSDRTIDSHIRRLREKLSTAGGYSIRTIHGVGYRLMVT